MQYENAAFKFMSQTWASMKEVSQTDSMPKAWVLEAGIRPNACQTKKTLKPGFGLKFRAKLKKPEDRTRAEILTSQRLRDETRIWAKGSGEPNREPGVRIGAKASSSCQVKPFET